MKEKREDQLGRRLKAISSDIKLYVEKRVELMLLNLGEQIAKMMAESLQRSVGILLIGGALLFMLVALSIYLGELVGHPSLGYLLVSFPLLVLGLMFWSLRPRMMRHQIQQHFEKEIIKALGADGERTRESLKLPDTEPDQTGQSEER